MQVHWSIQHVERSPQLDKAIESGTKKIEGLLVRYSPDLVHFHGLIEFTAAHQGPACSLNLRLPTGQLHARQEGKTALAALKACFRNLIEQIKKHKESLRGEGTWRRQRTKAASQAQQPANAD